MTTAALLRIPDGFRQVLRWDTNVYTTRNGSEQRVAARMYPQQTWSVSMVLDSEQEMQRWKFDLFHGLDDEWDAPLWGEAVRSTAVALSGSSTILGNFRVVESNYLNYLILNPFTEEYEIKIFDSGGYTSRTWTTSLSRDYPIGTIVVPIFSAYLDNGGGYSPYSVAAGNLEITFRIAELAYPAGYAGSIPPTYNSKYVLENRGLADGVRESFTANVEVLDFGGVLELFSVQARANINRPMSLILEDQQAYSDFKYFISLIRGQQISFYVPTYREDMTVVVQPAVGGTEFDIMDTNTVTSWDGSTSHLHLAIETADGDVQYKQMDPGVTTNNGDGTYTVGITSGLTATAEGSTIVKVSFLELCRLGSDEVIINHLSTHRTAEFVLRTIQS